MLCSNSCMVCDGSISDPVCKNCYLRQIKIILNDLQIHSLAKDIILNMIRKKFSIEVLNSTECILCKQENVVLCRYCFSRILVKILRELNFTEVLIKKFGYNRVYEENNFKKPDCKYS